MTGMRNFLAGLLFGALAAGITVGAATARADVIGGGQSNCCTCCCSCGCVNPNPTPPWVDPPGPPVEPYIPQE